MSIKGSNTPEAPSVLAHQLRTTIADFWSSSSTSTILFKRGNRVAFDSLVFTKLLINFIISNSLVLRIVKSISLRQLLEFCLSDIDLPSRWLIMHIMLSFYIETLEAIKVILQEHL
jgi:hypothetical protein